MSSTPTPDWQALSALYDEAETLSPLARADWLAALQAQGHLQWPLLQRMLGGAGTLLAGGYLEALPSWVDEAATGAADYSASAGEVVGAYRLIKPLGAGGMAEVWLAERCDGAFERQVALKLLFAQADQMSPARQENFRRRFEREHRILATLRHPNIAALHDAGSTPDGRHWLALEYVAGQPIDTWCDGQRLTVRQRVALFGQVLAAVAHAHARLVIHRDLKPGNVLVTAQGEVRLLDFGIAKLLAAEGDTQDETELTRLGGRPLTPRYASPEQLQGQPLDATSDVYTLGVMLYALLCGVSPYRPTGPGVAALERAILNDEPIPPSRQPGTAALLEARKTNARGLRRQLAPELNAIVLRAIARHSAGRYGSADALAADLTRWLAGEPVQARLPGPWARAAKFARRHPWGTGLGTVAVAALSIATAVATVKATEANAEAARARAASGFMLGLFEDADPDRNGGIALTPAQLLVRGRERLASGAAASPVLQGELLAGIAKAQMEMGDYDAAEASFVQWLAYDSVRPDAAQRARAMALRAENDIRRGQRDVARNWLEQSDEALPDAAAGLALLAKRGEMRGWIAHFELRFGEAGQAFDAALRAARAEGGDQSTQAVDVWLASAQNEAARGDAPAALAALAAATVGEAAQSTGKRQYIALIRAVVWDKLGEYRRVADAGPAGVAGCEREFGVEGEICRKLRQVLARSLLRQGHVQPAWALWPGLMRIVDAPAAESDRMAALQVAQRLAWQVGDTGARQQTAQRVLAMERDGRVARVRAQAALAAAESALFEGQPALALACISRAREHAGTGSASNVYLLAQVALLEGMARQASGETLVALRLMEEAQTSFDQVLGAGHPQALLLGMNRVPVLETAGQSAQALSLVNQALPVLRKSLGPEAPVVLRLQNLGHALLSARPVGAGAASRQFDPFG